MEVKIIPTGGLCNRLRAIATGIAVAERYQSEAIIYWNNSIGLKADFKDLFQPINNRHITLKENQKWIYKIDGTKDYLKRALLLHLLSEQCIFNYSIYRSNSDIYEKLKKQYKNTLLLISCYPMCKEYELKNIFVPQLDIQKRIDKVVQNFTKRTIGIHIRRTDNIESIKSSPLEAFINSINAELKKDAHTKFYLASDDDHVKDILEEKFPDSIITIREDVDRNTLEGMKFAVVDLFCLSKTQKIIGSVFSSYSQIAAELGNIEIEYAKISLVSTKND